MVMKRIAQLTKEPIKVRFHPRFLQKYGNINQREAKKVVSLQDLENADQKQNYI